VAELSGPQDAASLVAAAADEKEGLHRAAMLLARACRGRGGAG
jgi:hypothetical protein